GRLSDGTQEADFDDNRLRRLRVVIHRLRSANKRRRARARRRDIVVSTRAKATLLAAYCHYKPRRFSGDVDIIASGKLRSAYEPDKSVWGILLPRRQVHIVARRHVELFKAQGARTAALLQSRIDQAIAKLSVTAWSPRNDRSNIGRQRNT